MSGKLPAQTPPRVPVERKKRSCGECRRRKQKCDQKRPCRHCARRVPQPICEYENSPRIPSQVPDFAGLPNPTQTTQPGPAFVPVPFIPGQPDSWHRSSISSSISGSSAAELSWDPALFQQYPEPYPPTLPVDNTTAPDLGPYMSNNFLAFATEGPLLPQPSFFVETCMLSTETPTNRETTLAARYNAVNALQERINNPLLSTSDETIAQAIKLASNDLCYGEIHDLRVHIHGIQEMTRLRGGLQSLGMNGTLANMAIIIDRIIAIALEIVPTYTPSEVSSYISPGPIPSPSPPSSLEPATAALLKDVTFLLDTVLALPRSPSEWELQKLSSMSRWVYGRLTLPSPSQTSSSSSSLSSSSASASSSLHQSIRLASLIYCRAIQARKPFSQVVSHQDIFELTDAVWKAPLETWNDAQGGLLSTLIWVLVGILPVAKGMQGVYTTKTMIMAAAVQLAMVPGTVGQGGDGVLDVLERVVRLQRWLEGGNGQGMPAVSGPSSSRGGSGSPGV